MRGVLRHIIIVLILCGVSPLYAVKNITIYSTPDKDESTLLFSGEKNIQLYQPTKFDKLSSTKFFEITGTAIPMIVGGVAIKAEDNRFTTYSLLSPRESKFKFDDYIGYLPLVTKYVMKVSKVKGRSSWGRMITSDLFAVGLMAGSVELLKHTIDMPRPDGKENNSFPSGHTATAFMAATLLNKEYGHISPWIPTMSYIVASATAVGRQYNSQHWVSDLLVGAGIGIVSAELGYYFADLIFKDKGLLYTPTPPQWQYGRKPSRFTTLFGPSIILGNYTTTNHASIDINVGTRVGFEGVYFPHKNIGVGGRVSVSNNVFAVNDGILEDMMNTLSLYAGSFYETQLSSRWAIGAKTLFGYNFYSGKASWQESGIAKNNGSFGFLTGVSFAFLAKDNMRVALDCDYSLLSSSRVMPQKIQHELFTGISTSVIF